jgi:hypothetical protein
MFHLRAEGSLCPVLSFPLFVICPARFILRIPVLGCDRHVAALQRRRDSISLYRHALTRSGHPRSRFNTGHRALIRVTTLK